MTERSTERGIASSLGLMAVVIILLAALDVFLLTRPSHKQSPPATAVSSCTAEQLQIGSSGQCVKDAQTMVNFIETDGLNECPFSGGKTLPASGTYDAATAAQISIVQTWLNCYNKQEGSAQTVPVSGTVGQSTWTQLCTYAYQYPKASQTGNSPYLKQTITAGRDAGC